MTAVNPPRLLRAALAAAGRGWPVFPLIPGGKRPAINGWPHHASVDTDVLAVWWRATPYNVGIACGPAGLLVVDLDGPHGRGRFLDLAAGAGPAPTLTVATPSGGEHRYYTVEPGAPAPSTVGRLGPQIDTRGVGGYVVGPGSVRAALDRRRYYRLVDGRPPAAAPDWILQLLLPPTPRPQKAHRPRRHRYGAAAVAGECAQVHRAQPGTRNTVLFQAAVRLGTLVGAGVLGRQQVHDELLAASTVHCGVDGFTAAEAERAISNGLRYGQARPRPFRTAEPPRSRRRLAVSRSPEGQQTGPGHSGDEPATTRPGGTSLAALGHCVIPPGRATPEPPPSLRDPDPAR